jgi:peptidoglycan/LPS O-acetylase OafA/YrhL
MAFPDGPVVGVVITALALAIALATVVHFWVEVPAQRWLASSRGHRVAAPEAVF